jgi:hypothetical protein
VELAAHGDRPAGLAVRGGGVTEAFLVDHASLPGKREKPPRRRLALGGFSFSTL